jgi:hypothetical protein
MTSRYPSKPHSSVEYAEFTVGEETIALVSDPNRPHAWIRSNYTVSIDG